jgi:hypothetical protein
VTPSARLEPPLDDDWEPPSENTQTLTWKPSEGAWTVVVMNPDGARGLSVRADAGATIPVIGWVEAGLFAGGVVLLLAPVVLVAAAIVRAGRPTE